ncbi:MAG TPA: histone deacetylase, partial [Deltaproteobacteria bacterium]|nr:histone deacetylase [Deltaproteobacteria bacterium]
ILRVHDRALVDFLDSTRGQPSGRIDQDTYYCAESFDVARLAAGSCIDLVLRIMRDEGGSGLAAVRPPGHHAEAGRAMGFCLLNNVAIAVRALQAAEPDARVLILDWDVHHGNGTQHIFESDPSVLYLSTHQFPFYPGTGDFDEAGRGEGLGRTINIPMPPGCGDPEYVGVLQRIVVPAATWFAPDLILISCGFDAHRDDPLASMELGPSGYRAMTRIMHGLTDSLCRGRLALVLEGGYSLLGLREGTTAVLDGLTNPPSASEPVPPIDLVRGSVLAGLVDRVERIHGRRIPGLGAA